MNKWTRDVTPFSGTLIAFPFVVCLVALKRLFRCNEPGEKSQERPPPLKIVITIERVVSPLSLDSLIYRTVSIFTRNGSPVARPCFLSVVESHSLVRFKFFQIERLVIDEKGINEF